MLRKKQCTEVWNIELISNQPCQLLVFPFLSLQFKFSAHPCILINLCCLIPFSKYQSNLLLLIDWSVQDTCFPSPSIWLFLYNSSYLLQTPDNSNSFWFPQKIPVIRSRLYLNKPSPFTTDLPCPTHQNKFTPSAVVFLIHVLF